MSNNTSSKNLTYQEINAILSETLILLKQRKISPKRAEVITKLACALSENLVHTRKSIRSDAIDSLFGGTAYYPKE